MRLNPVNSKRGRKKNNKLNTLKIILNIWIEAVFSQMNEDT